MTNARAGRSRKSYCSERIAIQPACGALLISPEKTARTCCARGLPTVPVYRRYRSTGAGRFRTSARDDRRVDVPRETVADGGPVAAAIARWERVEHRSDERNQDDEIGEGPELRVPPRKRDQHLGKHDRRRRHPPPLAPIAQKEDSRRDEQRGAQKPERSNGPRDRLCELTDLGQPESFGEAQEVDHAMRNDDREDQGLHDLASCRSRCAREVTGSARRHHPLANHAGAAEAGAGCAEVLHVTG